MNHLGEAARWILRLLLAAAAATLTWIGFLAAVDRVTTQSPPVQTDALWALDTTLKMAAAAPRQPLTVAFFGDSLSMTGDIANTPRSTPVRLWVRLGDALSAAGFGDERSISLVRVSYSALSQWSLYYMASDIAKQMPDMAVLEFNLYNFGSFWRHHDRTILSSFLSIRRFPQALNLPLGSAGFATDAWLFHRALLLRSWLPLWRTVEHEQARCAEAYWILSDRAGRIAHAPLFTLRELHRLIDLNRNTISSKDPDGKRSTEMYARRLLGNTLTGVDESDDAIRMYEASLDLLAAHGVKVSVYVPPYNLEHLRSLDLLEGSRFQETIDIVRTVTERHGARFLDLHGMFGDRYFRDSMDHLNESAGADGHDLVAQRIAEAIADEARRIVADKR